MKEHRAFGRRGRCAWLIAGAVMLTSTVVGAVEVVAPLEWVAHYGNEKRDAGQYVAGLPDGSYLVTGYFEDKFNPPGDYSLEPIDFSLRDIFLARFDASGNKLWVQGAGSNHCDYSCGVSSLPDGTSVIIVAYGYGGASCTFGVGQPNCVWLAPYDRYDIGLAKYDGDGILQWARQSGSYGWDSGEDVALAPSGAVYATGNYELTCHLGDYDSEPSNDMTLEPRGGANDGYLAYYDTNGILLWALQGYYGDVAALADGSCVAVLDGTLVAYSADGTQIWSDPTIDGATIEALTVDSTPGRGEIVVAIDGPVDSLRWYDTPTVSTIGLARESVLDGTGWGSPKVSARADESVVVHDSSGTLRCFDPDGYLSFEKYVSAPVSDICATQGDNTCLTVGALYGSVTVGAGETGETLVESRGVGDIVLAKFDPATHYLLNIEVCGMGGVGLDPPGGRYEHGTEVTARACPTFPCHDLFDHWDGDWATIAGPEVTVTIDDHDINATAVFLELPGAEELPLAGAKDLALLAVSLATAGMLMMSRRFSR